MLAGPGYRPAAISMPTIVGRVLLLGALALNPPPFHVEVNIVVVGRVATG
ncbi:hypothetical protein [Achromobacter phage SE2]|nr:hypothetical protein [Achromobacter phage SE2]